jgi:hypothetical protein
VFSYEYTDSIACKIDQSLFDWLETYSIAILTSSMPDLDVGSYRCSYFIQFDHFQKPVHFMSSVESPRLNEQAEIQLSPPRKSAHFEADSDESDVEPEDISSTNLMSDYSSSLRSIPTLTPHVAYIRGWNQTWKIVMLTICLAG